MWRTGLHRPTQYGFDLRRESCASESLLLLDIRADLHQSLLAQFVGDQCAVRHTSRTRRTAQRHILDMRAHQRIGFTKGVAAMAETSFSRRAGALDLQATRHAGRL